MTPLMTQLNETSSFIQSKIKDSAQTAIILGSGLGNLATQIQVEFEIQ
jgi:purine nucleoside phosphorylase